MLSVAYTVAVFFAASFIPSSVCEYYIEAVVSYLLDDRIVRCGCVIANAIQNLQRSFVLGRDAIVGLIIHIHASIFFPIPINFSYIAI